jgi:hypothetical protein
VVLSEVARFAVMAIGVTYEQVGNVMMDLGATAMLAVAAAAAWYAETLVEQKTGLPKFAALVAAVVVSVPLAPAALLGARTLLPGRREVRSPIVSAVAVV